MKFAICLVCEKRFKVGKFDKKKKLYEGWAFFDYLHRKQCSAWKIGMATARSNKEWEKIEKTMGKKLFSQWLDESCKLAESFCNCKQIPYWECLDCYNYTAS